MSNLMAITSSKKSKAPIQRVRQKQLSFNKNWKPNTFLRYLPIILLSTVTWFLLWCFVQPLFGSNEYYIDEEFHVPQARRYCQAEFHKWDPKITTLPGLYLLSTAVLVPCMKIISSILSLIGIFSNDFLHNYDPCSLIALRAVNAVGAPACLYYAYHRCQLLLSQKKNTKSTNAELSYIVLAMSVATFPVIYAPYSMLYYTDAWATASVFLWYSYHLNKNTNLWIEIILGGFCVLCRQTNIAWLVFASIIDVCHCTEECFLTLKKSVSTFSYIQVSVAELYNCCTVKQKNNKTVRLIDFLRKCWHSTCSNVIVIGSFVMSIVLLNNGDIVVGDRQAHTPIFHPMQLCYFMVFVLGFSMPWLLSQAYFKIQTSKSIIIHLKIINILNQIQNNIPKIILFVILLTVTSGLVYSNTIAHPYLLADNRHYTFYVWRLLFGPGKFIFLRYLPVPLYAYGLYFVDLKLTQSSIAYKLAYWIVTPLILCAQFLLEPRYFVVPYLMYRLHSNIENVNNYTLKAALIEFIAYQIINIVIMWIFLYRPFISTMDDTGRLDRFTW